jgi:hypothetical protein
MEKIRRPAAIPKVDTTGVASTPCFSGDARAYGMRTAENAGLSTLAGAGADF